MNVPKQLLNKEGFKTIPL